MSRIYMTPLAEKQCRGITLWAHYSGPRPVRRVEGSRDTSCLELNTCHTTEQIER